MHSKLLGIIAVVISLGFIVNRTNASIDAQGQFLIAENGESRVAITVAADAPVQERQAALDLAKYLKEVTGASFNVAQPGRTVKDARVIAVGTTAARALQPDIDLAFDALGHDGIVMQNVPGGLILTGADGAERGTLYAVYQLLDAIGCRWWANDWVADETGSSRKVIDTTIPHKPTLSIALPNTRYRPPFEYRDPFGSSGLEMEWALPNFATPGIVPWVDAEQGRSFNFYSYSGNFVDAHTFDKLIPPGEFFATHPEWFSEDNGRRVSDAQLCMSNAEMVAEVTRRVHAQLASMPRDQLAHIWIGQNDNERPCTCSVCVAIKEEEGSYGGLLLRFVNAVADDVKNEFPNARIHTLIYRHTRTAPKVTRPADNVIIRLCSYECSFAQPLNDASIPQNKAFADDLRAWSRLTKNIWVWDYTINFLHYAYPFPNLYSLKPNLEFFHRYNVSGVFAQGNGQTPGGEFSVLRQWVLSRLMWDPAQDDKVLIEQFLNEYYEDAAPFFAEYIKLTHSTARRANLFLSCADDTQFLFTSYDIMAKADKLFADARKAVEHKPEVIRRVDAEFATLAYTLATKWGYYREYNRLTGKSWPFRHETIDGYADEFARAVRASGLRRLSEAGYEGHGMATIIAWMRALPGSSAELNLPADLANVKPGDVFVYSADSLKLNGFERGWVSLAADEKSFNGQAVEIPAIHHEWCVSANMPILPGVRGAKEKWTIYAVMRAETHGARTGPAVHFGVYDTDMARTGPTGVPVQRLMDLAEMPDDGQYHLYKLGTVESHPPRYIWLAPQMNVSLQKLWLERFILVRGSH